MLEENAMEMRAFRTRNGRDLNFSVIGFGSVPIGEVYELVDEKAAIATVEQAFANGIRVFDSSPHYGNGIAESRMGAGLRRAPRGEVIVSTKVGRVMNPFAKPAPRNPDVYSPGFVGGYAHGPSFDYSYDGTMRSVEQSLLRMGLSEIDVLLIHDCDVWTHGAEAGARFKEAMDGAYRALDKLRSEKTVAAIGFGINEAATCVKFARAGDFDVAMMAGRYTLLDQSGLAELLPLAVAKKMGVLLAGVFNSGILATGPVAGAKFEYAAAPPEVLERVRKIEAICAGHGTSVRRAALRFAMAHPAVVTVVLGAANPSEVAANVADAQQEVPAAVWSDLKSAGVLEASVPIG
ncbi:pyridoxal 4-dehydrogenase [Ramlibacter tataouinensis]|uniref:Pyridoxal 4-dehydrogenase n=2 Tax=Ramlibacter tataouinensis TaxID=94132 RepID=A0A127JZA2_9BURK|nr:pyridoxal 4-dehydrogenase [Ramlibacter tataouinensis]